MQGFPYAVVTRTYDNLYFLRTCKAFTPVKGKGCVYQVLKEVEQDTVRLLKEPTFLPDLQNNLKKFEPFSERSIVGVSNVLPLQSAAKRWLEEMDLRLKDFIIYNAYPGKIDLDLLLKGGRPYFEVSIFQALPEVVKGHLREATRCLLVGAPTAAVIMTGRAAGFQARRLYVWKECEVPPQDWGTLVAKLETYQYRVPNIVKQVTKLFELSCEMVPPKHVEDLNVAEEEILELFKLIDSLTRELVLVRNFYALPEEVVRRLCVIAGLSGEGSKSQLMNRLMNKLETAEATDIPAIYI